MLLIMRPETKSVDRGIERTRKLIVFWTAAVLFLVFVLAGLQIYGQLALRSQAAINSNLAMIADFTGQFDASENQAFFNNRPIAAPVQEIAYQPQPRVLAAVSDEEKWIEVNLSEQRLLAHEGDQVIYEFPISSGKLWTPTITGEFRIWSKFKYTKMSGGSQALGNYYYLPNVPFTMFFHGDYSIHGTYWHDNFGQPMSHGCVNMRTPDAEKIFYWSRPELASREWSTRATSINPGTRVIVHGKTPR